jgi:hypothetical protein
VPEKETLMANEYFSRTQVHAWSDEIGEQPEGHRVALQRLLKDQRRISKFIQENAVNLNPSTGGVGLYLLGVIARMFDLAGGRLKSANWSQIRAAESRVSKAVGQLLPLDDNFGERLRDIEWRAQPHILDEAIMSLFDRDEEDLSEEEEQLDPIECAKLFFLLWVAVEVMDGNWKPPKGFVGEKEYAYLHIDPKKESAEEAPA